MKKIESDFVSQFSALRFSPIMIFKHHLFYKVFLQFEDLKDQIFVINVL